MTTEPFASASIIPEGSAQGAQMRMSVSVVHLSQTQPATGARRAWPADAPKQQHALSHARFPTGLRAPWPACHQRVRGAAAGWVHVTFP